MSGLQCARLERPRFTVQRGGARVCRGILSLLLVHGVILSWDMDKAEVEEEALVATLIPQSV